MQGLLVINRDLFTGINVAQGKKQNVAVDYFHVGVRFTRMINVMRAVAATGAVQTEAAVDVADPQDPSLSRTFARFEI